MTTGPEYDAGPPHLDPVNISESNIRAVKGARVGGPLLSNIRVKDSDTFTARRQVMTGSKYDAGPLVSSLREGLGPLADEFMLEQARDTHGATMETRQRDRVTGTRPFHHG